MILLFYAFAREVNPLKRRLNSRARLDAKGLNGFRAEVAGNELIAVATGIGVERAARTARIAFEMLPSPRLAISTGVAGALSEGLAPGDLVMADRLLAPHSSHRDGTVIAMNREHLLRAELALRDAAVTFATGAMLTSDRILATAAEKRRAKAETGAIAVDMESAALAAEANARGIPFACIRAVLDTVDEDVIGAGLPDSDGRVPAARAAAFMIRNPSAIFRLPRLMRHMSMASRSLVEALEALSRTSW